MNDRIREVRKALDLTQTQFGERLGVSRSVIVNIELNRAPVSSIFLNHLCEVFGINRKWLETGEGEMRAPSDDAQDLIARMTAEHNLGPGGVMLLRAVARIFAELGPERLDQMLDEELPRIKRELVTDPTLIAAERASVPDPEAKTSD